MEITLAAVDSSLAEVRPIASYADKVARDGARRSLSSRGTAEWVEMIGALPLPLGHAVACIIWWDFLADRGDVPQHFALYVRSRVPSVGVDELIGGLIACGYPPDRASRRVVPTDLFFSRSKSRVRELPEMKEAA